MSLKIASAAENLAYFQPPFALLKKLWISNCIKQQDKVLISVCLSTAPYTHLAKCLSGNPPNFAFLLCTCSSIFAIWKINSLSLFPGSTTELPWTLIWSENSACAFYQPPYSSTRWKRLCMSSSCLGIAAVENDFMRWTDLSYSSIYNRLQIINHWNLWSDAYCRIRPSVQLSM